MTTHDPTSDDKSGLSLLSSLRASEAATAAATARALAATADHPVGIQALGTGALLAHGPGRYVNRAIGVGPHLDPAAIDTIEVFYDDLGLAPSAQISATTDEDSLRRLANAGFIADWFRSVVAVEFDPSAVPDVAVGGGAAPFDIVTVDGAVLDRWLDTLAAGNGITTADRRAVSDEYARAAHDSVGAIDFLALDGDEPVGCGSIQMAAGTAWLGGAATVPGHRRRGVQARLLQHRLGVARAAGCTVAAATATPAQTSARNLIRAGFRLVDTQLVMTRAERTA